MAMPNMILWPRRVTKEDCFWHFFFMLVFTLLTRLDTEQFKMGLKNVWWLFRQFEGNQFRVI
jgi:hypothetical protein